MNSILNQIILQKHQEIALAKTLVPVQELEILPGFKRECYVFKDFLLEETRTGIIAEFKRKSPSKGVINAASPVSAVAKGYAAAGASAVSVLTDHHFFGGTPEDLIAARAVCNIPLLRKDFILDEYQLLEAKAWGADIVLLIAAILTPQQIKDLANVAQSLGLNVLLEVHNREELERSICPNLDAVGVNNRNLADFSVNVQTSFDLVDLIPDGLMKISESAIDSAETIKALRTAGFHGFLIGESFMKTADPVRAFRTFSVKE